MYEIATIEDTVRVPPNMFDRPLEEVAAEILNRKYVGKLDKKFPNKTSIACIEFFSVF